MRSRLFASTRSLSGALVLALVASLLALGAGLSASSAGAADTSQYGSTYAKDGVLKRGCRNYRFSYSINPPEEGDWALETFIVGPQGKQLASDGYLEGFDETSGSDTFRLCRVTTRPGVFRIKAKLSTVDGNSTFETWLPESRFRLRAPR